MEKEKSQRRLMKNISTSDKKIMKLMRSEGKKLREIAKYGGVSITTAFRLVESDDDSIKVPNALR